MIGEHAGELGTVAVSGEGWTDLFETQFDPLPASATSETGPVFTSSSPNLRSLIRASGLTVDEFAALADK